MRRRLFALVALLAIGGAGCGFPGMAGVERPPVPTPRVVSQADPRYDGTTTVMPSGATGVEVRHAEPVRPGRRLHAVYPDVPGAGPLTERLKRHAERQVEEFLNTHPDHAPTGRGTPPAPELNVGFSFLALSGDLVGVRQETSYFNGIEEGVGARDLWYDRRQRQVHEPAALFDGDDAVVAVLDEVRRELESRPEVRLERLKKTLAEPDQALRAAAFTRDGDLVVVYEGAELGTGSGAPVAVRVPKAKVRNQLSDLGRRARAQAALPTPPMMPAGLSPVPRMPTPRAEPVPCHEVSCVAITFDGGPGPETARLLEVLGRHKARATFFVTGAHVSIYGDLLRAAGRAGHQIADGTWSHRDLTRLSPGEVRAELDRTRAAVRAATGLEARPVRPPYGAVNARVAANAGGPLIFWTADPAAGRIGGGAQEIADRAIAASGRGAILVFHESGPETAAALDRTLRVLSARGHRFVTVSERYAPRRMADGFTYPERRPAPPP
ncbi:MAG: polysaccharide deacetylase family protein [Streptosporangiales bacterium]|nr:polysaccharide deacetylase family protein [Streptosporangiales bacterium]